MQQLATTRPSHDATCLIIEDSQFDQQMMTRVVSKSSERMRIEVAGTLQSAREILAVCGVTLILLDNRLPDGIGADFALELASDPKHAATPIIMVSDWPSPFMWEKAASAGVLYVVDKAEFSLGYVEQALQSRLHKRARAS